VVRDRTRRRDELGAVCGGAGRLDDLDRGLGVGVDTDDGATLGQGQVGGRAVDLGRDPFQQAGELGPFKPTTWTIAKPIAVARIAYSTAAPAWSSAANWAIWQVASSFPHPLWSEVPITPLDCRFLVFLAVRTCSEPRDGALHAS
jgi:hypothetical protein